MKAAEALQVGDAVYLTNQGCVAKSRRMYWWERLVQRLRQPLARKLPIAHFPIGIMVGHVDMGDEEDWVKVAIVGQVGRTPPDDYS